MKIEIIETYLLLQGFNRVGIHSGPNFWGLPNIEKNILISTRMSPPDPNNSGPMQNCHEVGFNIYPSNPKFMKYFTNKFAKDIQKLIIN